MISKEMQLFRDRVEGYISAGRLHDAIRQIKDLAHRAMAWEVTDRLTRIEEGYAFMLKYVAEGVEDPDRASVYDGIVADLYAALDALTYFKEKSINPSQYYGASRTAEKAPRRSISALIEAWKAAADKISLFSLLSDVSNADDKNNRSEMERVQSDLFHAIWICPSLQHADIEAISAAIADVGVPAELKLHIISAVTLGLLEIYDNGRLQVLIDAYMKADDMRVSSAALVGLLLGLWKYRTRPLPRKIANRLAAAKEMPTWHSDLKIAFIEMIRARDTERINRKIQDEVIPDMLNLKPEIMNKINEEGLNAMDIHTLEENPEWQDLLDKNGITDKLKELTEMQLDGGDVMMSTFSHLKTFPFFYDLSNWFLPFSASNTNVATLAAKLGVMGDMVENAQFLCDNDKYSFMFALNMVPEQQRKLMTSQFQAQSDNIYQAMSDASNMTSPEVRKKAVNQYMQNIYRFFKLYRRKEEFFDPFNSSVNLAVVPSLAHDFDDVSMLEVVAEFYFKLGYMQEALDVFGRLESMDDPKAQRYQKLGYASEKMAHYADAIDFYHRAELLDQQSSWTLRRLAACYRALGDTKNAAKYYQQLAAQNPDDLNIALLLGYVMLECGDYKEALMQFYKVEFLDENSSKPWRPLAWTLFLTGDFDTAKKYYEKIETDNPTANDYLNMGHVALAVGDMKNAVNSYIISVQKRNGDREAFVEAMCQDMKALKQVGVKSELVPLVMDAVFYNLEK